jgi:hypothetical protein
VPVVLRTKVAHVRMDCHALRIIARSEFALQQVRVPHHCLDTIHLLVSNANQLFPLLIVILGVEKQNGAYVREATNRAF